MANNIDLIKKYAAAELDEIFVRESVTGILENRSVLPLREAFNNAKGIFIPSMVLSGLGNYDRDLGFPTGSVDIDWKYEEMKMDRAISFGLDAMDNEETAGISAGKLLPYHSKTHAIPEADAYRLSTLANLAGTVVVGTIADNTIVKAFATADKTLQDKEVDLENVVYFISTGVDLQLKTSTELIRRISQTEMTIGEITLKVKTFDGKPIIVVPDTRFKTLYDFWTGREVDGAKKFGFTPATNTAAINFMAVHYNASIPVKKHAAIRVFTPEQNINKDGWLFQTRLYHDIFVPKNKTAGIYVHRKAATDIKITFDANGGDGTTAAMTNQVEAATVTLTQNAFTGPAGLTAFKGWSLTPTGAVAYADKLATYVVPSANITLYAVWANA